MAVNLKWIIARIVHTHNLSRIINNSANIENNKEGVLFRVLPRFPFSIFIPFQSMEAQTVELSRLTRSRRVIYPSLFFFPHIPKVLYLFSISSKGKVKVKASFNIITRHTKKYRRSSYLIRHESLWKDKAKGWRGERSLSLARLLERFKI